MTNNRKNSSTHTTMVQQQFHYRSGILCNKRIARQISTISDANKQDISSLFLANENLDEPALGKGAKKFRFNFSNHFCS